MNIRAKFRCYGVTETRDDATKDKVSEMVNLQAVHSDDPTSENAKWSKATPAGSMIMTISNPEAFGAFEPGKDYFLDSTPVT
ncbi:hypothetical protein [Azospirillum himalayense]|uniref:Uncharacterized protein n=1 Tax=Azospirillum himalayense TaxID=654847 RepID=A0ABW0GAG4_9PROT